MTSPQHPQAIVGSIVVTTVAWAAPADASWSEPLWAQPRSVQVQRKKGQINYFLGLRKKARGPEGHSPP